MKKIFILLVIILFVNPIFNPAFAGGIGYINYDYVVENYQFAKISMREIETKEREIQQYLQKKEAEFAKIESPLQKQKFEENVRNELKTKEAAFNAFRDKREDEVYKKIHAVAEKIRLEKGLDALIDSRAVFSGGVDITQDLIKLLNSNTQIR